MIFYKEEAKKIRILKKLKATTVSMRLDIHPVTLSRWESGARIPSANDVRVMSQIYDIPVSEISDLKELGFRYGFVDIDSAINYINNASEAIDSDIGLEYIKPALKIIEKNKTLINTNNRIVRELKKNSSILNSLDEMIYIKDRNLKIKQVNSAFLDTYQLLGSEVKGKSFSTLFEYFKIDKILLNYERKVFNTGLGSINK
jgi:transcriptional regulator with XRE-family HTH domain